jgi:hypothetical protein
MHQESSGRADNHNYNPATGDDSYGLYQINLAGPLAASRPSPDWLWVAENNIKYAAEMQAGQGWTPWANTMKKLGIPY